MFLIALVGVSLGVSVGISDGVSFGIDFGVPVKAIPPVGGEGAFWILDLRLKIEDGGL